MLIKPKRIKKLLLLLSLSVGLFSSFNSQAETIECTVIMALPAVITTQGKYCLKGNLSTSISSGSAIEIQANNVTIDFNEYKLGGLAAGVGSGAKGVYALNRRNITLLNGNIRGFQHGVLLNSTSVPITETGGHIIKGNRFDGNLQSAIFVFGSHNIIQDNIIQNTGGSTAGYSPILSSTQAIRSEGPGTKILHNLINNTFADDKTSYGIWLSDADAAIVMHNKISNTVFTGDRSAYGIRHFSGTGVLFEHNHVTNPSTSAGSRAYWASGSSTTLCRDNTATNYTVLLDNCTDGGGNVGL